MTFKVSWRRFLSIIFGQIFAILDDFSKFRRALIHFQKWQNLLKNEDPQHFQNPKIGFRVPNLQHYYKPNIHLLLSFG